MSASDLSSTPAPPDGEHPAPDTGEVYLAAGGVRGQVLAYGLPGAGNVVVQHIVAAIRGPLEGFDPIKHRAFQAHIGTVESFAALARALDAPFAEGPGYSRPWYLNASVGHVDDAVALPALHSGAFLAEVVYGTHALPEPEDVASYRAAGGKVLVVLRHPLDVVTSLATKHVPHDHPDRRAARDRLLEDVDFVASFAWLLEVFWERLRHLESRVIALRYEDLLQVPAIALNHLAALLDRELSPDVAAALIAKVGTAELAAAGHLFEARADGWRGSLPGTMLPFFERVRELASPYGYDWPHADYRAPTPSTRFHVAAYCFWHPVLRAHLEAAGALHWHGELPLICPPDSKWLPRLRALLSERPDLLAALTPRGSPPAPAAEVAATA